MNNEKKNDKSAEAVLSAQALKSIAEENRKALKEKKTEKKSAKAVPAKPKKDDKPKATVKAPPDKPKAAGTNDWGHRIGSQAAQIDEAIKKVAKGKAPEIAALVKVTGLSNGRVSSHLKHLKAEKRI